MLGDYASRAMIATGVASVFTGDLLIRFVSSPNFVPACNLAGAVLAAGYAAWSAKRARSGSKAPSAATVAAVAEALLQVLGGIAKEFARDSQAAPKPLTVVRPDDAPDPAA